MELFEYIKSQLPQMPNSAIMKQMGASEELIDYVKETPWNTNLNMLNSLDGGSEPEVWFTGNEPDEMDDQVVFHNLVETKEGNTEELFNNYANYHVYLNGEFLSEVIPLEDGPVFANGETEETATMFVSIRFSDTYHVVAFYLDISTAPTSVEVSVKAK